MDTPSAPALVTLADIELVAAGTWQLSTGEATFTQADLAAAVAAAQCPAVGAPVLKLGHGDPRFSGEPAIGHVANMTLTASGNKITGDLAGMPGWLGEIAPSAYPQRSIEACWDFVCQVGHTHPFVINAVALLGTMPPGVGVIESLADVAALYGVQAAESGRRVAAAIAAGARPVTLKGVAMTEQVLAAGVTTEDIRREYYAGPAAANFNLWITELQVDPPQLIVQDDATAQVFRVPITIKAGEVSFSDPIEVSVEYVDMPEKAAASAPSAGRITWASRDKSRDVPKAGPDVKHRIDRLRSIRAAAGDTDADDDTRKLLASLDATLDEASQLSAGVDRSTVDEPVGQALDLITAAEAIADQLMDMLGIYDPDDVAAGGPHGVLGTVEKPVTHSHAHAAKGSQGGDETHEHSHTHAGNGRHDHAHASAAGNQPKGAAEMDFSDEQMAALRVKLGKPDDAELTADEILAAVAEPGKPIAASALPAGVVAIEQGVWDEMQDRVRKGEEARAQQLRDARDQHIGAAVAAGKFSVARVPYWQRLWDADPENTRAVLASLKVGQVPVDDIGAPGSPDDLAANDEFAHLFPPAPTRTRIAG